MKHRQTRDILDVRSIAFYCALGLSCCLARVCALRSCLVVLLDRQATGLQHALQARVFFSSYALVLCERHVRDNALVAQEARVAISMDVHGPLEATQVRVAGANVLGLRASVSASGVSTRNNPRFGRALRTLKRATTRARSSRIQGNTARTCRCCSCVLMANLSVWLVIVLQCKEQSSRAW